MKQYCVGFALLLVFGLVMPGICAQPKSSPPPKNEDCLRCHGEKDLEPVTERGKELTLFVDVKELESSAHAGMSCVDCHGGAKTFEAVPHADTPLTLRCAECHSEEAKLYREKDVHGRGHYEDNPRAPYCHDCHGGHQILSISSPNSVMSRRNQPETCGKCHGSEKLNEEEGIAKRNLITRYLTSVHRKAVENDKKGATCTDCHGFHTILPSSHADSTVSLIGILNTCVKCHPDEVKSFKHGPHGRYLLNGSHDSPSCTTCHGDHDMTSLRVRQGDAKHWAATQVCIVCHGNARMMARYGLDTTPVESYMKDFHGLTQRGSMGASATCADCHDAHNVLPSSHEQSRTFISNRGATCGKCHGKVSDSFAASFSHKLALDYPGKRLEEIVRILYILLIVGSVAGMLAFNFLIWFWAVRRKYKEQKTHRHINRLTPFEVASHFLLFLTFSALVVTGFALKYPDSFWVQWLFSLGMNETVRAFIHRSAAVLMLLDCAFFGLYMVLKKRGQIMLLEFIPGPGDFREFWHQVRFYSGYDKERPRSSIFSFTEKFEFWALTWGTVIMVLSGLILWFPTWIPASWPSWVINLARIIHFYEAVLATLAILIWHGFHTIWHPDEYPMNTSWLTGYITAEEAEQRFRREAIEHMTQRADMHPSPKWEDRPSTSEETPPPSENSSQPPASE